MLIRAFGQFWNPETIDWGKRGRNNRGRLVGRARRNGRWHEVDFWDARGIYVLHADFKTIYVGKAIDRAMGARLRDHLSDRFAGRWDMFSWFSLSTLAVTEGRLRPPGSRKVQPGVVGSTLEALGILIADPALNRKRERIAAAVQVEQVRSPHPTTVRGYLEQILERLPPNKRLQPTAAKRATKGAAARRRG
ncbi:MAG: GIY-YIG nuclease family protein [Vicinamibacterales bacterium]